MLQWSGRAGMTNRRTRNHISRTFHDRVGRRKLLNLRNWCEVDERLQVGRLCWDVG
jgi:hypothetical protein